MNLLKNFECLLPQFVIGPISQSVIVAGIRLPVVAKRNVDGADKPSCVPSGMAILISRNGIMAVKKTVSSGGMLIFNVCDHLTLYFWYGKGGYVNKAACFARSYCIKKLDNGIGIVQ